MTTSIEKRSIEGDGATLDDDVGERFGAAMAKTRAALAARGVVVGGVAPADARTASKFETVVQKNAHNSAPLFLSVSDNNFDDEGEFDVDLYAPNTADWRKSEHEIRRDKWIASLSIRKLLGLAREKNVFSRIDHHGIEKSELAKLVRASSAQPPPLTEAENAIEITQDCSLYGVRVSRIDVAVDVAAEVTKAINNVTKVVVVGCDDDGGQVQSVTCTLPPDFVLTKKDVGLLTNLVAFKRDDHGGIDQAKPTRVLQWHAKTVRKTAFLLGVLSEKAEPWEDE